MAEKKTYKEICEAFQWDDVFAGFDWNPSLRFNMAHEICDRHASAPGPAAVYWIGKNQETREYTFLQLKELSNRFANVLRSLGIKKGDRVACLLPKVPELLISILGTLKLGAVYVPLFTAFGPKAVQYRLNHCRARAVVTNGQFFPNVGDVLSELPDLEYIINVDSTGEEKDSKRNIEYWKAMDKAPTTFSVEEMKFDDLAIIQYTSGSTGMPKGAMWSNKTLSAIRPFLLYAVGLQPGEALWGPADPGWAYGLVASLLGPLSMNATIILCEIPFAPEPYYQVMEKYRVEKFLFAPVAYRYFLAAGDELRHKYDIHLKAACSGGEPLNPEVLSWFEKNFGTKIYDGYGCTETSMTISNLSSSSMPVKPGSMGLPLPGAEIALLDESGNLVPGGQTGQICYNTASLSNAFLGYLDEPEKTKSSFINNTWFKTGDLALRDEDGYYFFQGRNDDIIKSSGYRIGPFEIESTLAEHPTVADAAVIGVPDAEKKEAIIAYVQLRPSNSPSPGLADELILFVKNRLAKHQTPRRIMFLDALPRNPSGKVLRYQLREAAAKEGSLAE